jgi:two-component system OmpR family response regulator
MKMLIVEDEREIAEYLKKNFEKEGFIIDSTGNGEEGSYLARVNDYHIIILDHMLPGKTGLDIVHEVRGQQKTVPIIVLSVESSIPVKINCFKAGADDYVTKPFSFQELNARIRALVRRPYAIKNTVYHIDDMIIDSDKQEASRQGKTLPLTRKEFLLFECLAKENGKVMSRGVLMENVWNMNVDPFSNTLETHILNLRKKIGRKGKKIIKTVAGRGYRLDV